MKKKNKKFIIAAILFLIFSLAFFFRVYFSYDKVFDQTPFSAENPGIKYAADDGVYHMRLVENMLLGGHFPKRIYFDPYTYFPYGTYIHLAPLYSWILAGPIWLISKGKPTLELINKIAPFIPAVLGSLAVFVAYFAGRALFGKKTGLLASLIMAISSPYLHRSVLGATDHHVVETLFSGLAMLFLILALKKHRHPKSERTKGPATGFFAPPNGAQNNKKNKLFRLYTILSGISLGLYFLSWVGALIFVFIIGLFVVLYYLVEYCSKQTVLDSSDYSRSRSNNNTKGYSSPPTADLPQAETKPPNHVGFGARGEVLQQNPAWILKMGGVVFLIPLLMIAPFFNHPDIFHSPLYNINHLIALGLGILGFIFIGWLGNFTLHLFKKKGEGFIKKKKWLVYLLPAFLVLLTVLSLMIVKFFMPELLNRLIGMLGTVNQGMVGRTTAREIVSEMSPLTLAGALADFSTLFYLAIFSLALLVYLFIKKRKPEHLLIIVWTLTILLLSGIIPAFGQRRNTYYLALNISILAGFLIIKGIKFGWQGIKIAQKAPKSFRARPYLMFSSTAIILVMLFALTFPFPANIFNPYPQNLPRLVQAAIQTAKNGPAGPPGGENDWYPALAWLKENTPDTSLDYFDFYREPEVDKPLTFSEEKVRGKATDRINSYLYPKEAYGVLSRWDVGHMITYYAHRIPVANPFQQGLGDISEEGVTPGNSVFFIETKEKKAIQYLEDLRVKYVITDISMASQVGFSNFLIWLGLDAEQYYFSSTTPSKFDSSMAARLHLLDGASSSKGEEIIAPLEHFRLTYESGKKAVKIFEFVKGAKIIGQTPANSAVILSADVQTNQGRTFVYENTSQVGPDGRFEFTVPYAASYKIKIGRKEKEIKVSEEDVLEGKSITF